jgi:hypothetical protein
MSYTYTVDAVKKTLGKREVMDRIKDISLAYAIIAYEAVYLRRKLKLIQLIVFKIGQCKFLQIHKQ